jgi:hypothetical protein
LGQPRRLRLPPHPQVAFGLRALLLSFANQFFLADKQQLSTGRRESRRSRKGSSSRLGKKMSYLLPHLHSGWAVDQAILAEEERLVIIRFGHDWDETCMQVSSNILTLDSSHP